MHLEYITETNTLNIVWFCGEALLCTRLYFRSFTVKYHDWKKNEALTVCRKAMNAGESFPESQESIMEIWRMKVGVIFDVERIT